jgi:hypothetical protein
MRTMKINRLARKVATSHRRMHARHSVASARTGVGEGVAAGVGDEPQLLVSISYGDVGRRSEHDDGKL